MVNVFNQIVSPDSFSLWVCLLAAVLLAYRMSTLLSSWLTGVMLFPGLAFGALTAVEAAKRFGLIIGRDKETVIIGACFAGLLFAALIYYICYSFLLWVTSYNSRAYKELMQRCPVDDQN